MKEKVMEPVCWKGSSPSSTGARIEENYRCLVCRESAGKTSWEESDSKFCVSCAEKAGKYVAPKPIGSMDSDCLYKGAVYGELSYINGSGQCQQCQKGAWVDVDCQNCSTHNSPKHN